MPPFGDVKHAVEWGMSEAKYQTMQANKKAGFKKIKTSRDPRVVPNIPGICDEPGSRIPPPHATMPIAELKENVRHETNRFAAAGVLAWRENPETGSPEVLMPIEDRWTKPQPLNYTP